VPAAACELEAALPTVKRLLAGRDESTGRAVLTGDAPMMDGISCCGAMMWATLAVYALVLIVLAAGAVALVNWLRGRTG
jgi:hypothetical protein